MLGAFDQDRRELQAIDAKPGRTAGVQRIGDTDLDTGVAGADAEHAANAGPLEALQDETGIECGGVAGAEYRAHPQCQKAVGPQVKNGREVMDLRLRLVLPDLRFGAGRVIADRHDLRRS